MPPSSLRCELIASRTGVPQKTPPLACLDRKRAQLATLDKCPAGSDIPCFGPYAKNVAEFQGLKGKDGKPIAYVLCNKGL